MPSTSDIEKVIKEKFYSNIDCYGIKLTLDLLECYCKSLKLSVLKDDKGLNILKVYKLALTIYSSFDESIIKKINERLNAVKYKDFFFSRLIDKGLILLFKTKQEYLSYYKNQIKVFNKIAEGLSKEDFIN